MQIYSHGGVSGTAKKTLPRLDYAVRAGIEARNALDAVETAIRAMEDDPALNAGWGSVLDRDGRLELDAGIAVSPGNPGAVASVRVRHPISLARMVMEQTPHVLLTGEGAVRAAEALGLEILEDTTPEQRERWERARAGGKLDLANYGAAEHVDTVGAVAVDNEGRVAAGSSTGGVFGKLPGRVGDAPIFGAGFYAGDSCAVVGTGVGELFMRTLACLRVAQLIAAGREPMDACVSVMGEIRKREGPATAGLLALDSRGNVGAAYRGGSWAVEGPDGIFEPVKLD
jgi:L-asparaginase / beta-aspartyl-peptidase